jgi:biotin transporter BioY
MLTLRFMTRSTTVMLWTMTLLSVMFLLLCGMLSLGSHINIRLLTGLIIMERVSCPGYLSPCVVGLNANEILIGRFFDGQ